MTTLKGYLIKFILCQKVHSADYPVASYLPGFGNLTKGYNKYLRPNFGGKPVTIAMTLDVASISSISESDMDYTATIYLRQRWTDPRLVFQGNRSFTLDARLVKYLWVPDTYIVESKRSFLHEVTVENRLIRLFSNGTVLYALRITTTVACNMDLSKYPLDTQTCKLQMESWGYDENDVCFVWLRGNDSVHGLENLRLSQYTVEHFYTLVTRSCQETGNKSEVEVEMVWRARFMSDLTIFSALITPEAFSDKKSSASIYPRLVLQFELKRNILYFILETYVPSSLLVILSWVSFWITLDSVPARTCIGVTTVLSMTTLMMGSRKSMTNANGFIKAIDIYLGICFSFIFGALVEYAVAHYITSQKHAANETQKTSTKDATRETENKTTIDIFNTSLTASFNQKINVVPIDNASCNSLPLSPKDKIQYILKNKLQRLTSYFTIQNPSKIDCYSKWLFPFFFILVNLFYWGYYLIF
ncbi:Gamma-aminobutyric acid receptor subunit pi, partial [Ophiophagus hannah]